MHERERVRGSSQPVRGRGVCGWRLRGNLGARGNFRPRFGAGEGRLKEISCGDNTAFATAADSADLPADDGNACTSEACDGPNPTHPNKAVGTSCAAGDAGAGVCNGTGTCGVCEPGVVECSGNTPRSCGTDGSWTGGALCPFVCSGAGQCTGVCAPGALRPNAPREDADRFSSFPPRVSNPSRFYSTK